MKRLLLLILGCISFFGYGQVQNVDVSTTPASFVVTEEITITFSNVDPTLWNANEPDNIYLWAWYYDLSGAFGADSSTNGSWTNSDESQKLTNNGDGTYSITLTPSTFYGTTDISRMGVLVKAKNGSDTGSGEKKSNDKFLYPATNELTLTAPLDNVTIVDAGTTITISATTTFTSNFSLKANGNEIDTALGTTTYSYDHILNEDTDFVLEANDGNVVLSASFKGRITPLFPVPDGMLDGFNADPDDPTRGTLVLYAPGKTTVHVIGDFNNWTEDAAFLMNKDTARDRFWIELTGLTPQSNHMYQYLVDSAIRVADPYSTTILAETNDQYIDAVTYPDLPAYPTGLTNHAVTLLRTGDTPYNWEVTNFQRPEKTDLVIYELLIRDFDELHSFDAVKARLDYLETLGINAIEFMPLNEFDGNLSWGYNPSFHMALDKYYGTPTAFKQLIDECHKRGMAVIVDVVYNHATGQHPFYRMWNTDNGGYQGQPAADNPFFNQTATHAYAFFNDFNHQSDATKYYVERTVKYWMEEYHIDGFRWDLTKGFTQNCTNDEGCTNGLQEDRIAVLKEYADYQWEVDPDFYIIFEHLGGIEEEKQWADYRADEGKGIMFWNRLDERYAALVKGGNSNISDVSYKVKGFDGPSAVSYMESHDQQRLMYDVSNIDASLELLKSAGAFFFTVPGPKMIWQFGELGYDIDIDFNGRTGEKPILWEYYDDVKRRAVYETWSKLLKLKLEAPVFKTTDFSIDLANPLKRIHLTLDSATGDEIKHVTIIGNFGTSDASITPNFQQTGTWYDLMDRNHPVEITSVTDPITLAPGAYVIYGDKPFIDPEDLDSDGVSNPNDTCANTPLGATVNSSGCEIFSLPSNNFALQIFNETCRSSNNGGVSITAVTTLNYQVVITGNGLTIQENFTSTYSNMTLEAGDYTLCITVDGQPDFEQCFDISITEPEDLAVQSKVDKTKGTVSLNLSGSSIYRIDLNGTTITTSDSQISLVLRSGSNSLKVTGDKVCQGVFEDTLYFGDTVSAYPNPVRDILKVYLGDATSEHTIRLYTALGKLVYQTTQNEGYFSINMSRFSKGIYVLNVSGAKNTQSLKIVKQ